MTALTASKREYYLKSRQALLIKLGAIEDLLEMERSVVPKHKRRAFYDGDPKQREGKTIDIEEKQ